MRASFAVSLIAALALAACSSPAPPNHAPAAPTSVPSRVAAAPANPTLGSPAWYAWVSGRLHIDTQTGPRPGTTAWQQAVVSRLGQEAPTARPGTPQWQQAVDALLRTRLPPSAVTTGGSG